MKTNHSGTPRFFVLIVALVFVGKAYASPKGEGAVDNTIVIHNSGAKREVDINTSKPLRTMDPNFPQDGKKKFEGQYLKEIMDVPKDNTVVTFVCQDQYAVSLPGEAVVESGGFLAIRSNEDPIAKRRGGPIKVVFEEQRERGSYAWYVKAVFVGGFEDNTLDVTVGDKNKTFTVKEMSNRSSTALKNVPIPRGSRIGVDSEPPKTLQLIQFSSLVPSAAKNKDIEIIVTDYSGRVVKLSDDEARSFLIGFKPPGEGSIEPRNGGPFVVFRNFQEGSGEASRPIFFVRKIEVR